MEYGMRRIKDVGQRLNITVAMVPPKFVRQIEQGCHSTLKAQVRRERMEQWKSLKYETVLTEQTFEALRRCVRHATGVKSDRGMRRAIAHATDCGILGVSDSIRRYSEQRLGVRPSLYSGGLHAYGGRIQRRSCRTFEARRARAHHHRMRDGRIQLQALHEPP